MEKLFSSVSWCENETYTVTQNIFFTWSCILFGEDGRFVSNLCEHVVNRLVACLWTENTVFLHFHKNDSLPSSAALEALLQSGEHLIVIWASSCCYHDKKALCWAQGLYKETQRGLNWDCDWHLSQCRREGCNQSWLCVDSGTIRRSLKKNLAQPQSWRVKHNRRTRLSVLVSFRTLYDMWIMPSITIHKCDNSLISSSEHEPTRRPQSAVTCFSKENTLTSGFYIEGLIISKKSVLKV